MIELSEITDLSDLMRWRREVIQNVFAQEPGEALLEANRQYYTKAVADGSHYAVVASCNGKECGCGGLCFSEELPSPDNPSGKCAYVMNIYVRDTFRNKGIAHHIVRHLIEESRTRGCGKIYLETTADGKPVYESLGFRDMPDMMKFYDENN